MSITELKKNLKKYAKAHKGDWQAYEQAKRQIAKISTSCQQYNELIKFYVDEAGL